MIIVDLYLQSHVPRTSFRVLRQKPCLLRLMVWTFHLPIALGVST